ncbi:AT-rich interactive domain-containing protein 2-like [Impatiens glandulifera]|uniref:AT-rich interactive domain-containing protein 2-like n=1 Tax=Impatiens glandulifera TaxID=253017 RepID=UPI001FB16B08|nr:AT-rich interactive domain-containing protein 2-like [Impatiens glandulifera]
MKLKRMFADVLSSFLNGFSTKHASLPIPPLLEDGNEVDLFKLFLVVRGEGGYEQISEKNSWSEAAGECVLGDQMGDYVKLVYEEYLVNFNKWLEGDFIEVNLFDEEFNQLSQELKRGIQGLVVRKQDPIIKDKDEVDSSERRRDPQSLSKMLEWMLMAARKIDSPKIGRIPPPSQWKDYSLDKLWLQALSARESLVTKRLVRHNIKQTIFQKKVKVNSSMYEDFTDLNQRLKEKYNCSDRLFSFPECHIFACDYPCTSSHGRVINHVEASKKSFQKLRRTRTYPTKKEDTPKMINLKDQGKRIGPLYQAQIFEWTECTNSDNTSDPKWLGNTYCVPEVEFDTYYAVGKGRGHEICECEQPGSIFCTKFHIAEKRVELKRQIGSLFYDWKFDRMGEDVSLSWTRMQEQNFNNIVKQSNSLTKKFTLKLFPNKTWENVVSYYFNVFILRSRRFQNQITSNVKELDSDDEGKYDSTIFDDGNMESLDFTLFDMP